MDYLLRYQSGECSNVSGYKIGDEFFVAFVEIELALSVISYNRDLLRLLSFSTSTYLL